MHDLIIRNAHIVDGTGAAPFDADIAIDGGHIAMVGKIAGAAALETIDADGRLVIPGFVDIHTHYDGQATWDTDMKPSSQHGVTTVVMGNCGVGFAPVRPGSEPWLIALMEGVEDIPGAALTEGMKWGWESFPEYLDVLADRNLSIDIAAQVPHGALRGYVMGERGANNEPATADEIDTMGRLVREAIAAGAVGFSTSRIMAHQGLDGRPVPGTLARKEELLGIARAMRQAGKGVFEIIPSGTIGELPGLAPDPYSVQEEMVWMREFAAASGRPLTFTLAQIHSDPDNYLDLLRLQDEAVGDGLPLHGQYNTRPGGVLTGLQSYHAFQARASYKAIAHLPLAQRAAEMRKPEIRAAILSEPDIPESASISDGFALQIQNMIPYIYPLSEPVDYEPDISRSVAAQAQARGMDPLAHMYDLLADGDGSAVFIALAANFADNDHRAIEIMLRNPNAVPGLADGGAHARLICDASNSTYLLTHWARDRRRGTKFPIEMLVKKQASDTARLYGLDDRGTLKVGKRADINIIDFDRLGISAPYMVNDLPAGGARYLQDSQGYDFTFVRGVATRRDGQDSGARPGGLVRSRASANQARSAA